MSQAEASCLKRMGALEVVLEQLGSDGATAGAATVVGAMISLLKVIDPHQTRAYLGSYLCQWERYWAA